MNIKKICVVTGARSEFGLIVNLLRELKKSKKLKLFLVVTGMHLMKEFGNTYKEIENEGLKIFKKIKISDSILNKNYVEKSVGNGVKKFSKIFKKIKPDLVCIPCDRYEMLGPAISSYLANIPIAHFYGGEITKGSQDDITRNVITKMSNLHFVNHSSHRKRVIQMGENPKNVFLVGSLGQENILNAKNFKKKEIEKKLNIKFNKRNLMVSYHPETISKISVKAQLKELLLAIKHFSNINFIFTSPNVDPGNNEIIKSIKRFVKRNKNTFFASSLGQDLFFSCIKYSDGMVGNSSSGIIELPVLRKGTVNIGHRQEGRVRTKSIIDTACKRKNIILSINKLYSKKFQKNLKNNIRPFKKSTSKSIVSIINNKIKKDINVNKKFFDLKF